MRKIIVSEFLSLDGVMETPEKWVFQYTTSEIQKFKLDEVLAGEALLLGYATYQIFANSWPQRTDPEGFADKMNRMPKYVVTHTPEKLAWNNSRAVHGEVPTAVSSLKRQPGGDILVAGSGVLVQTLMRYNLVDGYRLLVYPIVLGKGKRLFMDGATSAHLKLTETKTYDTGVVLLRFEPAEAK